MRGAWVGLVLLLALAAPQTLRAEPVACGSASGGSLVDGGHDYHVNETSRADCSAIDGSQHSVHRIDADTNMSGPVGKHHVVYLVEFDSGRYATSATCPDASKWASCSQFQLTADGTGLDSRYGAAQNGTCTYTLNLVRPTGKATWTSPEHGICEDWHRLLP